MGSCLCMSHSDPKNFYCHSETTCLWKGLVYPAGCTISGAVWKLQQVGIFLLCIASQELQGLCLQPGWKVLVLLLPGSPSSIPACESAGYTWPSLCCMKDAAKPSRSMGTYWFSAWILLCSEKTFGKSGVLDKSHSAGEKWTLIQVITGHSLSMTQGCTSPCAHTPAWALRASHSPSLSTLLVIFASPHYGAGNVSIKFSFGQVSISNTLADTGDRLFWRVGAVPPFLKPPCCPCPAGLSWGALLGWVCLWGDGDQSSPVSSRGATGNRGGCLRVFPGWLGSERQLPAREGRCWLGGHRFSAFTWEKVGFAWSWLVPALTFPAPREHCQGWRQAVISESNKNTTSFSETWTCLGLPWEAPKREEEGKKSPSSKRPEANNPPCVSLSAPMSGQHLYISIFSGSGMSCPG